MILVTAVNLYSSCGYISEIILLVRSKYVLKVDRYNLRPFYRSDATSLPDILRIRLIWNFTDPFSPLCQTLVYYVPTEA